MSLLAAPSTDSIDPESLEAFLEDGDSEEEKEVEVISNAKRQKMHSHAEASPWQREEVSPTRGGLFSLLPTELSLQLLERLSAVDLTSISQTCTFFSRIATGNELWQPLYACRWHEGTRESGALDQPSWKANYMERDAQRGKHVSALITDKTLRTSYLKSLVAERHKPVQRARNPTESANKLLLSKITRWRGAKGLLKCPSPGLGSEHRGCSQRGGFVELPGGVYMCESCGWAHICTDGCPEKLVDEASESLVCPISGRCFDRMMLDWEDEGKEEVEGEAGCDFGVAGHWGRAYSSGYNCSSEEELRRQCGIIS